MEIIRPNVIQLKSRKQRAQEQLNELTAAQIELMDALERSIKDNIQAQKDINTLTLKLLEYMDQDEIDYLFDDDEHIVA